MCTKACKQMITAAFSITTQNWTPSTRPSVGEWANKMSHIHTIEYCSAIKMNKLLMPGTTRTNLQNVLLSERSQTQKTTRHGAPWLCRARSRWVYRHWYEAGQGRSGCAADGPRHQRALPDGDVLQGVCEGGCTAPPVP